MQRLRVKDFPRVLDGVLVEFRAAGQAGPGSVDREGVGLRPETQEQRGRTANDFQHELLGQPRFSSANIYHPPVSHL